jgi:uncharacterized DUF497 family protein
LASGIDFATDAEKAFSGDTVTVVDDRFDYSEIRSISRGKSRQDRQVFGVHCLREVAGLMLRGIPALTAGSGADGLK